MDTDRAEFSVSDLRAALAAREFVFYYQPRVSMVMGVMTGAEALVRWIQADGTVVPPDRFIPLAESSGFITELTLALFEQLIRDFTIIHAVDRSLEISFNVSAHDLESDTLANRICDVLRTGFLPPGSIELELTESVALNGSAETLARLDRLKGAGASLAMDDFGTGYASVDTLARLPFSAIKIDQGLVRRMGTSSKDETIVESSVRLGHELGLTVVAEGIESRETWQRLQAWGCTTGQGYWLSRPVPLDAWLELYRRQPRWPARQIGQVHMAMLDHLAWRKAVMDLVFYGTSGGRRLDRDAVRDVSGVNEECRLGHWLLAADDSLRGRESFDLIWEPHRRLHALGATLLSAAVDGRPHRDLLPLFRALSEQSLVVVGLLQDLEDGLMSELDDAEGQRLGRVMHTRPPEL